MNPPKFTACKVLLILVMLLALWRNCRGFDYNNEYVKCGFKDNSIMKSCPNGGFIYNPDRSICPDRYLCYRGPGESCNENLEMRCEPGMTCNCGVCQNCDEKNCNLKLCPLVTMDNSIFKRWFKRFEKKLSLGPATRFEKNFPLDPTTDMVAYLHN